MWLAHLNTFVGQEYRPLDVLFGLNKIPDFISFVDSGVGTVEKIEKGFCFLDVYLPFINY